MFSPFIYVTIRNVYAKLTLLVWWSTIALELVILARLLKKKMIRQFPFFFTYLSCVLLSSASGYLVYEFRPLWYQYWYWSWEFVCVIAGYSVILEIIEQGLEEHPAVRKAFRNLGLVVLGVIVGIISLQSVRSGGSITLRTSVEVERDLRAAEAVLLILIMVTVAYYGIRIGKNLRGITLGYGLCVATIVMGDALWSYSGKSFQGVFSALRSWSYLVSLLIWLSALWAYQPSAMQKRAVNARSGDHRVLVAQTTEAMEPVRGSSKRPAGDD